MATKPASVTIRVYNVGFGDCILLSWHYASSDRHLLIDFGSSAHPDGAPAGLMMKIANDIKTATNGKLEAVVVTHRHLDHINGFDPGAGGNGPGAIIAGLNPKLIVQPWTEHPKATATSKSAPSVFALAGPTRGRRGRHAVVDGLAAGIADELAQRVRTWRGAPQRLLADASHEITHAIANQGAVDSLRKMAVKAGKRGGAYVNAGQNSGLGTHLPGVKVSVLGPPSLDQVSDLSDLRYAPDSPEYWLHLAAAQRVVAAGAPTRSRGAGVPGGRAPAYARWLIEKLRLQRANHLSGIVTALDNYLNNTSVILLFEVGTKALLFPGDAQLENWQYALTKYAAKLPNVTLYKVGHHGSRNATPKTLWNQFNRTGNSSKPDRLITVLSTKRGKFDDTNEVPREALVTELKKNSTFHSTLDAPAAVVPIKFDVTF
jgi:hypothetical protein